MSKRKKNFVLVMVLLLAMVMLAGCCMVALAASEDLNVKYDDGDVGTHSLLGGKITFEIKSNGTYTYVDWWSSTVPIYNVMVKGGNGFIDYNYDGDYGDTTNLESPVNASGHPADISHVTFTYREETPPTETPAPPTETPAPPTETPAPPTATPVITDYKG